MVKINVVNNKFVKLSPYVFGTLFTNINECTVDKTVEKTFANIGITKNMVISDFEGQNYKVTNLSQVNNDYIVDIKQL